MADYKPTHEHILEHGGDYHLLFNVVLSLVIKAGGKISISHDDLDQAIIDLTSLGLQFYAHSDGEIMHVVVESGVKDSGTANGNVNGSVQ